jgi:uncharacterized short protein YbdD (DUF466 family)
MKMTRLTGYGRKIVDFIRQLSGDDSYERYLQHWQNHHAQQHEMPMSRADFFKAECERKWNGVKRCC